MLLASRARTLDGSITRSMVWLLLLTLASAGAPSPVDARPRTRVALETVDGPDHATVRAQLLAHTLHSHLGQHPAVEVVSREHAQLILQARVMVLSERDARSEREVDCRVSMIVTDAVGGAVRMTLAGHAVARGEARGDGLQRAALEAAVRGALSPLERGLSKVDTR